MLTINPNEESLLAWPGLDTLVRRVVLRRPEEPIVAEGDYGRPVPRAAPERPLARRRPELVSNHESRRGPRPRRRRAASRRSQTASGRLQNAVPPMTRTPPRTSSTASPAWPNGATERRLPKLSNDLLDQASGITIPSSNFVLRVILAYLIAVIPLNWLICRFVLNRREWTWVVVPLVALAFAVGVERVAARDIGYDTAADEIDLLEIHGDYPRAHLTRLVSLYSNGRSRFTISYPNDPTALALPFDSGLSIRGEDVSTSTFQSYPVPSLIDFTVQPRSLSMFRAEQMLALSGSDPSRGRGGQAPCGQWRRARAARRDPDRSGGRRPSAASAGWARSPRAPPSRSTDRTGQKPPERIDGGPWPRRQPVPGGIAHELGSPRGKPG